MRRVFLGVWDDLRRTAYGAPRGRGALVSRLANAQLFVPVTLLAALYGIGLAGLVAVVDPYDLRPWGLRPTLTDAGYPPIQTVNLVRVVAEQPHDLVMVGGSTTMAFSASRLNQVFGTSSAVNVSYMAPMPADAARVTQALVRTPGLKRMIVAIDFSQMRADREMFYLGKAAVMSMDGQWFDMPDFSLPVAQASLNRLRGRAFDLPAWRPELDALVNAASVTTQSGLMATLDDAVARPSLALFNPAPTIACTRYPYVAKVLLPAAREARARGVQVDLIFPPIPFQTYYNWQKNSLMFSTWAGGSHFRELVGFHRCIVEAIASNGLSGVVTVHALDTDPALTQLADYRDTVHLTNGRALTRMLVAIRDGTRAITRANLDRYARAMDAGVANVATWRAPR